jgi:hypothetical protein
MGSARTLRSKFGTVKSAAIPVLLAIAGLAIHAALAPWSLAPCSLALCADFPPIEQLPSRPELPDPLTMFDGTPVTTREQWFQKRRPEIRTLFEYYEYGRAPAPPKNVVGTVVRHDPHYFGGKSTKDEVRITFGPTGTPPINLLLVIPNRHSPTPVFVALNFCGNSAVLDDPSIELPAVWMPDSCEGCVDHRATDAGRGSQTAAWAIKNAIDRGYAIATFYDGDIDPDKHDFTDGVHPHYFAPGQTIPGEHDWGTIRAWAWGLSRAIDYLETRSDIDHKRICATGHSRLGKTAIVAAAFDERIALVAPHQSGTGGCALSRNNDQETVERINRVFPHWFNDVFPKFAGREDRLPVDQHLLMCLVAPRPTFDSEGDRDKWANGTSSLRALKAADKVYKFLGARGLVGTGTVRDEEPLAGPSVGDLVQYRRDTKHELSKAYWNRTFDFADGYFARRR